MAGITQLALKKINLIFPGEHERMEWHFIQKFVIQPDPSLFYNPGLSADHVHEFCNRCYLLGIAIIGLEVKDEDRIPLESHSWEEYVREYNWHWITLALQNSTPYGNGNCYYPVPDISPGIICDYLES